jgi:hypothetical protein
MAEGAPAERLSAPASAVEPTRLDTARELRNPVPRPQPSHERQPPSAPDETGEASKSRPKCNWKRKALFALLPLALIAGGYFYVTGGPLHRTLCRATSPRICDAGTAAPALR